MKRYDSEEHIIIAVCDDEIIGKKFNEGDLFLYLDECFYKGIHVSEEEVKEALSHATIANISGSIQPQSTAHSVAFLPEIFAMVA
jgi:hypothetical protein